MLLCLTISCFPPRFTAHTLIRHTTARLVDRTADACTTINYQESDYRCNYFRMSMFSYVKQKTIYKDFFQRHSVWDFVIIQWPYHSLLTAESKMLLEMC